MIVGLQF